MCIIKQQYQIMHNENDTPVKWTKQLAFIPEKNIQVFIPTPTLDSETKPIIALKCQLTLQTQINNTTVMSTYCGTCITCKTMTVLILSGGLYGVVVT